MKNKKIKCDIYTRVSTTMQVDGYSLDAQKEKLKSCLLYTSPSPRDGLLSRMPSSA